MRVASRIGGTTGTARAKPTRPTASGFAVAHVDTASAATAVAPVLGMDALLALQATDFDETANEAAMRRGGDLLNHLDALHRAMIDGQSSDESLARLKAAVSDQGQLVEDQQLAQVINDIEVRAAVEIAKREHR